MTPTTPERWLPVVGYEGLYEVSDHGRVRSLSRYVHRADGALVPVRERMMKLQARIADGYLQIPLNRDGKRSTYVVHGLVLTAFVGRRPEGMHGCHNDGDLLNNRLDNLRWDSPAENNRDLVRHGTHWNVRKTHCPRGHALKVPNLRANIAARSGRGCLACHRATGLVRKAAGRGEQLNLPATADAYFERIMRSA